MEMRDEGSLPSQLREQGANYLTAMYTHTHTHTYNDVHTHIHGTSLVGVRILKMSVPTLLEKLECK